MIQAFGATVHLAGPDLTSATEAAMKSPGFFVDDGENVDVVQGAGTAGLEIAEELGGIDGVFIPMGGGALAGGCATALKALQPQARVISVQSHAAPAMTRSFRERKAVSVPARTLADGLVCGVPPTLTLNVLWNTLDDALLVEDADLLAGVHTLAQSAHVLVEPAGAAALAGAWQKRAELRGRRIVLVLSGANVTDSQLRQSMDAPPFTSLA